MAEKTILLCAGGTGGHLFPAEAVAHELRSRGYLVHLAADERVQRFADSFPCEEIHIIRSATLSAKNPVAIAKSMKALASGYLQSKRLLKDLRPRVVAGFGGYPTVPPVLAAARSGIPTLVHEANAVLGRANRFLGKRVDRVAIGFGNTSLMGDISVIVTGNPVRPAVLEAAEQAYSQRRTEDPFNLLVFGGSQGAAYFGQVLPAAIRLMDSERRNRLRIVQQARAEDADAVRDAYGQIGVKAEVAEFFTDMAERIAAAHLVVSRGDASTVSELAVIGRPALLVPYPHALDHDQAANAENMKAAGGAVIHPQQTLSPEKLATELTSAMDEPKRLALAAKNAKKTGRPDATQTLAAMIETLSSR